MEATTELDAAICSRLLSPTDPAERAWRISQRAGVGRYLVAARDLSAGEVVFSERPIVVASPDPSGERAMRGEMAAVAIELLKQPAGSPAHLLQEADFSQDTDGSSAGSMRSWTLGMLRALKVQPPMVAADGSRVACTEEAVSWALGVASVNVHGAKSPERGVLGLLASMMEHDCSPSTLTDFGPSEEGSIVTLRTRRKVNAGESLSITYVAEHEPVVERRKQLRLQHGFVCACKRCEEELGSTCES